MGIYENLWEFMGIIITVLYLKGAVSSVTLNNYDSVLHLQFTDDFIILTNDVAELTRPQYGCYAAVTLDTANDTGH